MSETRITRREFLLAGGLAAGRLLLSGDGSGREAAAPDDVVEVRMTTAGNGSGAWFDPVGLRVMPGTAVRWRPARGVHTATAYHPENGGLPLRIPPGADPWDSGYLTDEGDAFTRTFRREGIHDYFCRPHEAAGMVGRIVVARSATTPPGRLPGGRTERGDRRRGGRRLPDAASGSFPSVSRILREGRVPPAGGGGAGRRPGRSARAGAASDKRPVGARDVERSKQGGTYGGR